MIDMQKSVNRIFVGVKCRRRIVILNAECCLGEGTARRPEGARACDFGIAGARLDVRVSSLAQFLFVIACWFAVAGFADSDRGGDDFLARVDLAKGRRAGSEAAAIICHIVALFLDEGRME